MAKRLSTKELLRDFENYHEAVRGHSHSTSTRYRMDVSGFLQWFNKQHGVKNKGDVVSLKRLSSIKRTDIYEYLSWASNTQKASAATRARRIASLRSFFNYLTESTGLLDNNPTIGIRTPKIPKRLPIHLSQEQSKMLLNLPRDNLAIRDRTILMLFLTCGLRISELSGLDMDRVYQDSVKVIGKGNKERLLFFSEGLTNQMSEYLSYRMELRPKKGHEKALFLSFRRQRLSVRGIQGMLKRRLEEAGLSSLGCSPHKLRHTAATLMLQNGVDIRVISEVLGHENLGTTQIYTHVRSEDKQKAADSIKLV